MERAAAAGIPGRDERVTIAADHAKFALPEYAQMVHEGHADAAAGFMHEESSLIAKQAEMLARTRRQSMVIDGLGDSSAEKLGKKVEAQRAAGYTVKGRYATIPTSLAVERAANRAKATGFNVPEKAVLRGHRGVSAISDSLPDIFDDVEVYFTGTPKGTPPTLLASSRRRGSGWTVQDSGGWDAFLAKANE
jgi:predicted ABC-type ATPase